MEARRRAARWAFALGAVGALPAEASTPAPAFSDGFPVTSSDAIFELEEVERGDRGIGYTVFDGAEVGTFDVEILGIMEDMLGPDRPVILARLSGERIEFTGVISGMSGSPVYIDGRLVGAVAYRFGSFAREPIAGITPIRSMLEAPSGSAAARPVRRVSVEGLSVDAIHGRDASWLRPPESGASTGSDGAQPITVPLTTSRLSPAARTRFLGRVEPVFSGVALPSGHARIDGMVENEAGSVGGVTALPIAPASPIAALLVKGDLNIAAIGTVTFVEDDRVLAFGHPFVGFGRVAFPMATAGILNTLASEAGSYKQGIAAREVGVIRDDRLTAISGRLGQTAKTVPFVVRFTDVQGQTETTRVEVVADPFWLPILLEAVASSALEGRLDLEVGGTVEATMRVVVSDRALELSETHAYPAPLRVTSLVGRDLATVAAIVARNDLAEPRFERVELEARYRPQVDRLEVLRVVPDRRRVEAGGHLGVDVELRDYRGAVHRERLELPIPRGVRGEHVVYVGAGTPFDGFERRLTGRRRPTSFDELLGILADRRPDHRLVGGLFVRRDSLTVGARAHPSPPDSWRVLIESAAAPVRSASHSLVSERSRRFDAALEGGRRISVVVHAPKDLP